MSERALVARAKGTVKRALRAYGVMTSRGRSLPDFMIIGAKRGGTTSLYRYLAAHPQVAPLFPARQKIKGTYFFDVNFHRGLPWYRSHFRRESAGSSDLVTGEASPYYLFHPLAAKRAAEAVPHTRPIVLLRNPVDRAYSHWKEQVRRGFEPLSFEDALAVEPERLAGEEQRIRNEPAYYSFAHEHHSYVGQGRYLERLAGWLERFPRERVLVLRSEDLYRDPASTLARVLEFLGLPAFALDAYEAHNFHPADAMTGSTRTRLIEAFAPHNEELSRAVGMTFEGWDA